MSSQNQARKDDDKDIVKPLDSNRPIQPMDSNRPIQPMDSNRPIAPQDSNRPITDGQLITEDTARPAPGKDGNVVVMGDSNRPIADPK